MGLILSLIYFLIENIFINELSNLNGLKFFDHLTITGNTTSKSTIISPSQNMSEKLITQDK